MSIGVGMIVAMASNRVIGRDNQLPWHLPGDLKYFKATTMGKPIVMGRKTFESIGKPLPGRANIVVTRSESWSAEGVDVVHSAEEALSVAKTLGSATGVDEVMVIGGEQLYRACLPMADTLYVTLVHAEVDGDAWFPEWDSAQWRERNRQDNPAEGNNPFDYSFVVYERD